MIPIEQKIGKIIRLWVGNKETSEEAANRSKEDAVKMWP